MFFVHTAHNTYTAKNIRELAYIFAKHNLKIKENNKALNVGTKHISIDAYVVK